MRLSDEEITAVRNSADIAEVIGHYAVSQKRPFDGLRLSLPR